MQGFLIGFCVAIGWVPCVLACWLLRRAFSMPLDLGEG